MQGSEVKRKVREALGRSEKLSEALLGFSVFRGLLVQRPLCPSQPLGSYLPLHPVFITQVPKSLSPLGSDLGKSLAQATLVLEGRDCR